MSPRGIAIVARGASEALLDALRASFDVRITRLTLAAFARALREARLAHRAETLVAFAPSTHPSLVLAAWIAGVDRLVVDRRPDPVHGRGRSAGASRRFAGGGRALRAAFALVDWTVIADPSEERGAIAAGADPERLLAVGPELVDRILLDPPRIARPRALAEAALSLVLDATEATGALWLLEALAPDRGVNVVNYHRVLPVTELHGYCRPEMAIGEPVFAAQLQVMMERRGFTRVDRIRDPGSSGRVAITFDDGYEDNFRIALPILRRFSTPACIFLVTNLVGEPDALWWDRLGLGLFAYWRAGCPGPLPPGLPPRAQELRATRSFTRARAVISGVISDLNGVSAAERDRAVDRADALVPEAHARRTMLTWEEVQLMAAVGVMFGAHTQNHVPLDEVPIEVARQELFGSQRELDERLTNGHPRMAALPRGRLGPVTEDEMRREGFEGIMTTEAGVNHPDEDSLFVLRRDGRMLTLYGRHHPAKLRLELTGLVDRLRSAFNGGLALRRPSSGRSKSRPPY